MKRHQTAVTQARTIDSPIGPITLAGDDDVLTQLVMHEQRHAPVDIEHYPNDPNAFGDVVDQLKAYWEGDLTEFDVDMRLEGTEFQQEALQFTQDGSLQILFAPGILQVQEIEYIGIAKNKIGREPVIIP